MQTPHPTRSRAAIASFLIPAALASATEPSGYTKEPGAFYPPEEEVHVCLERFLSLRKQAAFEGTYKRGEIDKQRRAIARDPKYSGNFSAAYMRNFRASADFWARQSDDFVRAMIPAENPRMLVPNYAKGCPLHLGGIQTLRPVWGKPNCYRCQVGGEEWAPGIQVKNPATGDLVTIADNGYGWQCPEGFPNPGTYYFVAAYRLSRLKMLFSRPYRDFVDFDGYAYARPAIWCTAYTYALTQDERYAHKVLVMLTRLADVYRNFTSLHNWRAYKGRAYVTDHNFECNIIRQCLDAYDFTFDTIAHDTGLLDWFRESRTDPDLNDDGAVDHRDITYHIERNLFGYMYEFVHRGIRISRGNTRTWQLGALVEMAVAFRHDRLLEEALDSQFGLRRIFTNCFYREGRFYEDSTGYAGGVNKAYLRIGSYLSKFRGRKTFPTGLNLAEAFGRRYANIRTFKQRAASAGRLPYWGDGGNSRTPIFSPSPEAQRSELFGDIGYAILRSRGPAAQQLHLLPKFAQTGAGHGHRDQLMLKPIRWGYDFTADLGYPHNLSSPKRNEWCANSVTHCTVMVNNMEQRTGCTGTLDLYADADWLKMVAAHSNDTYDGVELYHRTAAIVSMSDDAHYIVDLFRIKGGQRRDYIYHSLSGDDGSNFALFPEPNPEPVTRAGTLAGVGVEWMASTGRTHHNSVDEQPGRRNGYSYIKDIATTTAGEDWRCEWRTGDAQSTGLMLWMAGAEGRQLYQGKGEGKGAPGRSPWDAYVVARDDTDWTGSDYSTFCCILEPFQGQPRVRCVERLPLVSSRPSDDSPVAVKVTTPEGHFVVFSAMEGGQTYTFDTGYTAHGRFSVARVLNDGSAATVDVDPGRLPAHAGRVCDVDFDAPAVSVACAAQLPVGNGLRGQPIIFEHSDWPKNAVFTIDRIALGKEEGTHVVALQGPGFEIATGTVDKVNAKEGWLFTKDSLEKLFNCHRLFDGKALYNGDRSVWRQIDKARAGYYQVGDVTIRLKSKGAARRFKPGGRFYIMDVNPGATFRIPRVVQREGAKG